MVNKIERVAFIFYNTDQHTSQSFIDYHFKPDLLEEGFDTVVTWKDVDDLPNAFDTLRTHCDNNDWVALFLFGHGNKEGDASYVYLRTGDSSAIFSDSLANAINNPSHPYYIPHGKLFLFVDACRAGQFEYHFKNKDSVVVVTSTNDIDGLAEFGNWGWRGKYTFDFFYGYFFGTVYYDCYIFGTSYKVYQVFSYLDLLDPHIFTDPRYDDSNPSQQATWFNW